MIKPGFFTGSTAAALLLAGVVAKADDEYFRHDGEVSLVGAWQTETTKRLSAGGLHHFKPGATVGFRSQLRCEE